MSFLMLWYKVLVSITTTVLRVRQKQTTVCVVGNCMAARDTDLSQKTGPQWEYTLGQNS
jgi:hypothetical protein